MPRHFCSCTTRRSSAGSSGLSPPHNTCDWQRARHPPPFALTPLFPCAAFPSLQFAKRLSPPSPTFHFFLLAEPSPSWELAHRLRCPPPPLSSLTPVSCRRPRAQLAIGEAPEAPLHHRPLSQHRPLPVPSSPSSQLAKRLKRASKRCRSCGAALGYSSRTCHKGARVGEERERVRERVIGSVTPARMSQWSCAQAS